MKKASSCVLSVRPAPAPGPSALSPSSSADAASKEPSADQLPVFDRARDAFLASLSPEDRLLYSPCATLQDFMEGVHKLETITSEKKYGKRLGVISEFAKNLNVYFGVVDILVSSNPQYAALAW